MNTSNRGLTLDRRRFISVAASTGWVALAAESGKALAGQRLTPSENVGQIQKQDGQPPVDGATWYVAEAEGAGLVYRFAPGALLKAKYLAADMLLDGNTLATFMLALHEGGEGRVFQFCFGGLNQCTFRVRMALGLVDLNRLFADREGGLLKPMCLGERVDLDKVDRMVFTLRRKSPNPVRWCMTPFYAAPGDVEKISNPVLPKGALLDEFGQSTLCDWPGKTRSVDELKSRIRAQYEEAPQQSWPNEFSVWGGWRAKKLGEGTGFFRTHHDGKRWWLVDPDGCAFWSAGLVCVRVDAEARYDGLEPALQWLPDRHGEFRTIYRTREGDEPGGESVNYLAANMIRALGPAGWRDNWARIALAQMRRLRFNTVGNWSEWNYARDAKFPYVHPMEFRGARTGSVYRDFPDVFHPAFERDAAAFAAQLKDTAADPAFIGYFLMNEPTWGSSSELPAAGMLYNTETCATRVELAGFLRSRYADDAGLAAAWKRSASLEKIAAGKWNGVFGPDALNDLREFSVRMVERYFQVLSQACRHVDPHHLNLGMRWAGVPPVWAVEGMKCFDVFSLNCYRDRLPMEQAKKIAGMVGRPVMVGEWHFGALDAGLPASGIGHLKNQEQRAKAYRVYLEDAAADPYCVGVHWFTMYDESALGRYDGENYNIGFFDTCNRPYDALSRAAVASHERMYQVADGQAAPFNERLEYLPKLFL